jgi:hypothetical protein
MRIASNKINSSGQAMIAILFVVAIVLFLTTQAALLNIGTTTLASDYYDGDMILIKTEGYLENAALRFLRNPAYSGESLQEGDLSCTMQVVDLAGAKDITATCGKDQKQRKLGMTVTIASGVYSFSKIEERE